jgi:hypothetical protein
MSTSASARAVFAIVLAIHAGACSGSDDGGTTCPAGTTARTSTNELNGPGFEEREDAIRAELENLDLSANGEAITTGVVQAEPGERAGTEVATIETDDGSVATMTLAPLDPGWAVEASTWCAPA